MQPDSLVAQYSRLRKRPGLRRSLFHMRDTAEQPSRLHLLTFDPEATLPDLPSGKTSFQDHDCKGYTCDHELCVAQREHRVANLSRRPRRSAQPWEPKKAA